MGTVVHPIWLYLLLALGALGVSMALPRPRVSPQVIGGIIGAAALGGLFLILGLNAGDQRPGLYFYLFSAIALGACLRVISHPKPVYAALYFILTIISSSALYLMLQAEFLAFALIIIYAGAILITYLFVIMLAEQSPNEAEIGATSEYDRYSREPGLATAVGFILLALLTTLFARGLNEPTAPMAGPTPAAILERMPKKVVDALDRAGVFAGGGLEKPALPTVAESLDPDARTISLTIRDAAAWTTAQEDPRVAALNPEPAAPAAAGGARRVTLRLPESVRGENIDGVGFALIGQHPMALELAGIILLMAMLGAVVLARRQTEIGEAEKARAAASIAGGARP